jgi:hypothetical protein
MKIKELTLTVILALLVSIVAGMQTVEVAEANFKPYKPPKITIFSPSPNQIYNSSNVLLNVSVVVYGVDNPAGYDNITSLNYSLDGQQDLPISFSRSPYGMYRPIKITLSNLSDGPHSIFVHGESTPFGVYPEHSIVYCEKIPFNATVTFTVETHATSIAEPFPTIPILAASIGIVAIVAVGLLVYFKKRTH